MEAEAFLSNLTAAFGAPSDPAGASAAGSTTVPAAFSNLPYAEHQAIFGRVETRVGRWLLGKTAPGMANFESLEGIENMAMKETVHFRTSDGITRSIDAPRRSSTPSFL